jgi:Kelch motif protein
MSLLSSVVYNGYIYTTGGSIVGAPGTTSTVFYAQINSNGTVGVWATTTKLPNAIYQHSAVVSNGYIYTTGGFDGAGTTSTVFYAPINSNGSIGNWTSNTPLSSAISSHSAVVSNGYIYTTGANGGGSGSYYSQPLTTAPGTVIVNSQGLVSF